MSEDTQGMFFLLGLAAAGALFAIAGHLSRIRRVLDELAGRLRQQDVRED